MFKIVANPTFQCKVQISIPGIEKPGTINVEFAHLTRQALKAFYEEMKTSEENDAFHLRKIIVGWSGVDTPYSTEALDDLLDHYPAAARELFAAYSAELMESKRKN